MEEGKERGERRQELDAGRARQARKKFLFVSKPFTHINDTVLAWPSKMSREIVPLYFWLKILVYLQSVFSIFTMR